MILLKELSLEELIDLAKSRRLLDSASKEGSLYRIEVGAASFRLDAAESRDLIERLIRSRCSDVE